MQRSILTRTVQLVLMLAVFLMAVACDQSPIFQSISNETERKIAAVPGTPTRTVRMATSGIIFVANGKLLKRTESQWSSVARPGSEPVRDLAAIGDTLFAMTLPETGSTTKLWKSVDDAANWTQIGLDTAVSGYTSFDSLFTAGPAGSESLFVGAHSSGMKYAILRTDANGADLVSVRDDMDAGGMLTGAAYLDLNGEYYLSTVSEGIWSGTILGSLALETGTDSSSYTLSGMIAVDTDASAGTDTVVAVGRGEYLLLSKDGADFTFADKGFIFTGALAVYKEGTRSRLLAGIESSPTYGFMEIDLTGLDGAADAAAVTLAKTGGDATSTSDYNQYAGALGTEAVRSLSYYTIPANGTVAEYGILFASTVNEGLWSSTNRGDWNLES